MPTPQFNSQILVSGAQYMSNELPINPYMNPSEAFDTQLAIKQHTNIIASLRRIGVEVLQCDPPEGCQDGVFMANIGLLGTDNETILLAQLPEGRREETPYYEKILEKLGKKVIHAPDPTWYLSGQGDALRYGPYLLAGQGFRTTPGPESHTFMQEVLGYTVISLQTVGLKNPDGSPSINTYTGLPNSEFYDIDYAVAPIRWPSSEHPGLLAVCKEAFTPESLEKILEIPNTEIIWVPYEEATGVSACNLVSTGNAVAMNAGAPVLEAALREHGLQIDATLNDELKKNGGSVRCIGLTLRH